MVIYFHLFLISDRTVFVTFKILKKERFESRRTLKFPIFADYIFRSIDVVRTDWTPFTNQDISRECFRCNARRFGHVSFVFLLLGVHRSGWCCRKCEINASSNFAWRTMRFIHEFMDSRSKTDGITEECIIYASSSAFAAAPLSSCQWRAPFAACVTVNHFFGTASEDLNVSWWNFKVAFIYV